MPSFRDRTGHQEAVSRRLAQLGAELAGQHPDPAEPSVPGPAIPVPGRHAARRGGGRWGLGPAHLLVVAVLAALGLGLTAWWAVRGQPQVVDAPAPLAPVGSLAAGTPVGETTATAPAASPSAGDSVTVDVAGKVRRPGIVVLDEGARVVDAVTAAGGARRGVDLSSVNLARVLVDGEQIVVGAPGATAGPSPPGAPAAAGGALVNINTASPTELESLPEVGPVTAQAIVTWREEHGGFSSVDELLEVDGIGDATLAQITPHVTV
jgi:competence protein ComEA